jgi:hypothetical protein
MAKFEKCKNCTNTQSGTKVYQCKKCSGIWCESCSTGGSKCQHCEADLGFFGGGLKILGQIDN